MYVIAVQADPIRSLAGVKIEPSRAVTAITGPNGAGKTNLLEALYFGLTGRSFRTSDRRDLIPFGESLARAEVVVADRDGIEHRFLASVTRSEGRRHLLEGKPVSQATAARHRPFIAVFAPDRLQLIKGPPSERRAHLDALIGARWPARAELRAQYGRTLAQRNAMIARINAGHARPDDLDTWDQAVARIAAELLRARSEVVAELSQPFADAARELGLSEHGTLRFQPRATGDATELAAGLRERREADLKLGRTSWGPHLDELAIEFEGRSLRRYGSQGQQRAGLLALIFAERDLLSRAGGVKPLLLLDDVMSELDPKHRELLGERLADGGQCLITAADAAVLPKVAQGSGYVFTATGLRAL